MSQPRNKPFEAEVVGFVATADESIGVVGASREAGAIDGEKGVGGGERRPFVAVSERMILREAFP